MQLNRKHLKYLDSVRGIASLCVVFHHCFMGFEINLDVNSLTENFIANIILDGKLMVYLFFCLSARVLTMSYLSSSKNELLVASMIKRPLRLGIPTLGALFCAGLLYKSGIYSFTNYAKYTENITVNPQWNIIDYPDRPLFANIVQTFQLYSVVPMPFPYAGSGIPWYQAGVLWSLAVECFYSYYVYIISFILTNLQTGQLLFLGGFFLHSVIFLRVYSVFVVGLGIGYLDYRGFFDIKLSTPTKTIAKIFLYGVTILLLCTKIFQPFVNFLESISPGSPELSLYHFFQTSFIMLSLSVSPTLQEILCFSPLLYLGKISFGIYLMHGPFLPVLKFLLAHTKYRTPLTPGLFVLSIAVYLIPVILASHLFTVYIDGPSMTITKSIYKALFTNQYDLVPTSPGALSLILEGKVPKRLGRFKLYIAVGVFSLLALTLYLGIL